MAQEKLTPLPEQFNSDAFRESGYGTPCPTGYPSRTESAVKHRQVAYLGELFGNTLERHEMNSLFNDKIAVDFARRLGVSEIDPSLPTGRITNDITGYTFYVFDGRKPPAVSVSFDEENGCLVKKRQADITATLDSKQVMYAIEMLWTDLVAVRKLRWVEQLKTKIVRETESGEVNWKRLRRLASTGEEQIGTYLSQAEERLELTTRVNGYTERKRLARDVRVDKIVVGKVIPYKAEFGAIALASSDIVKGEDQLLKRSANNLLLAQGLEEDYVPFMGHYIRDLRRKMGARIMGERGEKIEGHADFIREADSVVDKPSLNTLRGIWAEEYLDCWLREKDGAGMIADFGDEKQRIPFKWRDIFILAGTRENQQALRDHLLEIFYDVVEVSDLETAEQAAENLLRFIIISFPEAVRGYNQNQQLNEAVSNFCIVTSEFLKQFKSEKENRDIRLLRSKVYKLRSITE